MKWWPVSESNQGHSDFQSLALPTELTGHLKEWKYSFLALKMNLKHKTSIFAYLTKYFIWCIIRINIRGYYENPNKHKSGR